MEHYVGLDVSLKLTAICIVDRTGRLPCDPPVGVMQRRGRYHTPGRAALRNIEPVRGLLRVLAVRKRNLIWS